MRYTVKIIAAAFLAVALLSGCGSNPYQRSQLMMGTIVRISVTDQDKPNELIQLAVDKAFVAIERVYRLMDSYSPDSQLARLNSLPAGELAVVPDELFTVVKKSIEISRLSQGSFDITAAPLLKLWGFGGGSCPEDIPDSEQIRKLRSLVDYNNIILSEKGKKIGFLKEGMAIDLGGIAKGYAVDQAAEALRREGIKSAIVDAGGDIYCLGGKSRRHYWNVGVKDPRRPGHVMTTLRLKDIACATSGGYENFFVIKGRKFSHFIDPRNCYPVQNNLVSVTVLAPSCLEADGLATAVFILGEKKGLSLINSLDGIEAVAVRQEGQEMLTSFSQGLCRSGSSN